MATISITHPHGTSKAAAKEQVQQKLGGAAVTYGFALTWHDDVCEISGPATGKVIVDDTAVSVELKLGFLASAIKGKIESALRRALG